MMEYKGYVGNVEFDDEANIFHGEVLNLRDVVTFEGTSVDELRQAFRDSVEDYLEFCKKRNEEPEKPFSGKFVIRLSSAQHRRISYAAKRDGKSLNTWVAEHLLEAAED